MNTVLACHGRVSSSQEEIQVHREEIQMHREEIHAQCFETNLK